MKIIEFIKEKPLAERLWLILIVCYFIVSITGYIFELFYMIATGKNLEQLAFYQFLHTYHNLIILSAILYSLIVMLIGHKRFKRSLKLSIEGHNKLSDEIRENMDRAMNARKESVKTLAVADEKLSNAENILKQANKKLDEALEIQIKNELNQLK